VGVVALVAGLFGLATGHIGVGSVGVILAALAAAAGIAWLAYAHHRVRTAELQWAAEYSEQPAPPPTS
jgi:lactate dehydrogenase-like 2-hydroxyacid dehydrogenase